MTTNPTQQKINEWWLSERLGQSAQIGNQHNQGPMRAMIGRDIAKGQKASDAAKAELVHDGILDDAGRLTAKAVEMGLTMPQRHR